MDERCGASSPHDEEMNVGIETPVAGVLGIVYVWVGQVSDGEGEEMAAWRSEENRNKEVKNFMASERVLIEWLRRPE